MLTSSITGPSEIAKLCQKLRLLRACSCCIALPSKRKNHTLLNICLRGLWAASTRGRAHLLSLLATTFPIVPLSSTPKSPSCPSDQPNSLSAHGKNRFYGGIGPPKSWGWNQIGSPETHTGMSCVCVCSLTAKVDR